MKQQQRPVKGILQHTNYRTYILTSQAPLSDESSASHGKQNPLGAIRRTIAGRGVDTILICLVDIPPHKPNRTTRLPPSTLNGVVVFNRITKDIGSMKIATSPLGGDERTAEGGEAVPRLVRRLLRRAGKVRPNVLLAATRTFVKPVDEDERLLVKSWLGGYNPVRFRHKPVLIQQSWNNSCKSEGNPIL